MAVLAEEVEVGPTRYILIADALVPEASATDWKGRPKRIWNAVDEFIFVGDSCNLAEPKYNCYPAYPPNGKLFNELQERAERTIEEVLAASGDSV